MTILGIIDTDELFFSAHPDRRIRIRECLGVEQDAAFMSLGDHDRSRRRMLVWQRSPKEIVRIPFLLFADESIRDDDETLMPILHGVMEDSAKKYGIPTRRK